MAERYLRNTAVDERGRYYDGYIIADPGEYSLYAYNINTETTLLRNSNSHREAMAYTDDIASHIYSKYHISLKSPSRKRIVYDCDHLFVADCGRVEIPYLPYSDELDTLTTLEGDYFLAESIVKSYYLQVKVKGMNYVSSVAALMDGVAGSAYLWERKPDYEDEVWLSFDMTPSKEAEDSEEEVVLYTTFGTFGKIPDIGSGLEIALDFTTKSGTPYAEVMDITHEFETSAAIENQWIIIDRVIEVPLPVEDDPGGMKPGVGNWGDIYTEIII